MTLLLFLFSAWAYTGLNLGELEELKSEVFQSYETGWMGITADGIIRVYVADSEEEVQVWMELMKERLYKYQFPVIEGLADEAYGDGRSILLVRHENIGLLAQGGKTHTWINTLETLMLQEGSPLVIIPQIQPQPNGRLKIFLPESYRYSFVGGMPVYTATGIEFTEPPENITVWNPNAKATKWVLAQDSKSFTPMEKSLGVQPK